MLGYIEDLPIESLLDLAPMTQLEHLELSVSPGISTPTRLATHRLVTAQAAKLVSAAQHHHERPWGLARKHGPLLHAQGAIPASALTAIVKPFRRLSELLVPDTPLSPAEVAEVRGQLPCLDDIVHQKAGQYEEMVRDWAAEAKPHGAESSHHRWPRQSPGALSLQRAYHCGTVACVGILSLSRNDACADCSDGLAGRG